MDELERLRVAMVAFPLEQTPFLMYVDELMQVTGCARGHAEWDANQMRRDARVPALIAHAENLLAGTNQMSRQLRSRVRKACQNYDSGSSAMLVCAGSQIPTKQPTGENWHHATPSAEGEGRMEMAQKFQALERLHGSCILVGAEWVAREAYELGGSSVTIPTEADQEYHQE